MSICQRHVVLSRNPNSEVRPVRYSQLDFHHCPRLWIQLFYTPLNPKPRAGFAIANSASDARSSGQELCKQLIEARAVDMMIAVGKGSCLS